MKSIYIIGSLHNKKIPAFANRVQKLGFEAFSDWFSPGFDADKFWKKYCQARGQSYAEALRSPAGTHVFEFDKFHIDRCDAAILYLPAGRSGHLELGYALGSGKKGYILFPKEPEKWDVMYQFATGIFFKEKDLFNQLKKELK